MANCTSPFVAKTQASTIIDGSKRLQAPDFAEFTLGPAEGKTRGLNPGYDRWWPMAISLAIV
jgi:hypothetical protein